MTILLLDDERTFADNRESLLATSTSQAIELTDELTELDELWLDYILRGGDTTDKFLSHLINRKRNDNPLELHKVIIHTSSNSAVGLLQAYLEDLDIDATKIAVVNHAVDLVTLKR